MEGVITLVAFVLGLACLIAQLRLFRISDSMDKILSEVQSVRMEIQAIRLLHLHQAGRLSEDEYVARAKEIFGGR